jgi:hypothetical protein
VKDDWVVKVSDYQFVRALACRRRCEGIVINVRIFEISER